MAKIKDNVAIFKDFLKNADSITVAIVRAIVVSDAENKLKNKEEIIEQSKNSIVSGELYIRAAQETVDLLGFDK